VEPVELRSERLILSAPTADDVDAITRYCQDPLFERFLTTPWPYGRADAVAFVDAVARRWAEGSEYTLGIRLDDGDSGGVGAGGVGTGGGGAGGGPLIGMVGWRARGDVGFWMGAEHRGRGYMVEALATLVEWVFVEHAPERITWETLPGNLASARVARAAGFRYTGIGPVLVPARDGSRPDSWHGELLRDEDRDPKPGWPL
jgi:RimJ/RimL family protein N-acetyltransferase